MSKDKRNSRDDKRRTAKVQMKTEAVRNTNQLNEAIQIIKKYKNTNEKKDVWNKSNGAIRIIKNHKLLLK